MNLETLAFLDAIGVGFYLLLFIYVIFKFIRSIRIVPAKEAYIVERFGKYSRTLEAGFHTLIPFIDKVVYRLTLKEEAIDVPAQDCFTKDNVLVKVDGVIYMRIVDPYKTVYNINNYHYAAIQLAQTTMRSVFGHLDLDKTFEERTSINGRIVQALDQVTEFWGVDILRYEIQNIKPSQAILQAMEKQMTAERDKRAAIALSEGEMTAQINRSEGIRQELINRSEGEKQKKINEAEGKASEIRSIAKATAAGIRKIAVALQEPGGSEAMQLNLAEDYLSKIEGIAKEESHVILPMDLSNPADVLKGLNTILKKRD
jgi:regulator of protease activity HflC (stomatin/prohibitin superfamily)